MRSLHCAVLCSLLGSRMPAWQGPSLGCRVLNSDSACPRLWLPGLQGSQDQKVQCQSLMACLQGGKDQKAEPPYGADVLRLWVASVDYTQDVVIGGRILTQVCSQQLCLSCKGHGSWAPTVSICIPLPQKPLLMVRQQGDGFPGASPLASCVCMADVHHKLLFSLWAPWSLTISVLCAGASCAPQSAPDCARTC